MNREKLPIMIDLLSDDSEELRAEVLSQLSGYGPSLEKDLNTLFGSLNDELSILLNPIIESNRRKWIESNWIKVAEANDDFIKIETALNLVANFQYGLSSPKNLSDSFDKLQQDFLLKYPYGDEMDLAAYLFQTIGIKGDQGNYYNPFNSNPLFALNEKKGNPITLCMIYVLIAWRCGFNIVGCNFPGHFLAKVIDNDEFFLVDCFNGGKIIYDSEIQELSSDSIESVRHIILENPDAKTIIRRILFNLQNSYSMINQYENASLFEKLSKTL